MSFEIRTHPPTPGGPRCAIRVAVVVAPGDGPAEGGAVVAGGPTD